jgi:hypothetical protein
MIYNKLITKIPCNNWDERFVEAFVKIVDNKIVPKVNANCKKLMEEKYNSPFGDRIQFKRETLASEAIFFTKKKYIIHSKDLEGVRSDKFKYVGVSMKKNEIPTQLKNELCILIEKYMPNPYSYKDYCDMIEELWHRYCDLTLDDIAIKKGYNTPKDTLGFLKLQKGAGAHVRAAVYYNQLLEKMGLGGKYEPLLLGDKVNLLYIKSSNKYGIDVIGYNSKYPEEFNELFEVDKFSQFKKTILSPMKQFHNVLSWKEPNPTQVELGSLEDL